MATKYPGHADVAHRSRVPVLLKPWIAFAWAKAAVLLVVSPQLASDYAVEEAPAERANNVAPGDIAARATPHCIGLEWPLIGDRNGNATCAVRYRVRGEGEFREAMPLFRLRKHNEVTVGAEYPWEKWPEKFKRYARDAWARNALAGSIFSLEPDTEYEIELSLRDPDGGGQTRSMFARTAALPTLHASGPVIDIEPNDIEKLKEAVRAAKPGTVIRLHSGVYETSLELRSSGTAADPIVVKAAGDGEVVFQGLGPTVRRGSRSNNGFVLDGDHWRIHDLVFREWFGAVTGRGRDVAVTRCRFLGGRTAISARGEDWYIADNVMRGFQDPASGAFWPEGIQLRGAGHVIRNNSITRHGDQISLECRDSDVFGNDLFGASDDGIECDLGGPNLRIWGNRIYSIAHNGVSFQPYLSGPCYLIRNQITACGEDIFKDRYDSSGLVLVHNTFVNASTVSLIRHVHARNNLFIATADAPRQAGGYAVRYRPIDDVNWSMDLDYNAYTGGIAIGPWRTVKHGFQTVSQLSAATGNEVHGVSTTPAQCLAKRPSLRGPTSVMNPPPMFALAGKSPAVDAGQRVLNVSGRFQGRAPDIGALELGEEEPFYGPRPRENHDAARDSGK